VENAALRNAWRPRLSLRALLVFTTLLCLWLGWRVSVVKRIDGAVQTITSAGGGVRYPTDILRGRRYGATGLKKEFDRTYVKKILLGHNPKGLPNWVILSQFGELESNPSGGKLATITQAIRQLSSIEYVDLANTQLSSNSCLTLARISQIRWVRLGGTRVNDADLDRLAELTHLQDINLCNTNVSDAGAVELAKRMPGCRVHHEVFEQIGKKNKLHQPRRSATGYGQSRWYDSP